MRERALTTFGVFFAVYYWVAVRRRSWPPLSGLIRQHRENGVVVAVGCLGVMAVAVLLLIHWFADRGAW